MFFPHTSGTSRWSNLPENRNRSSNAKELLKRDILVLVTDAPDDDADKALHKRIRSLNSLQSLSMTFGHNDEQ